MKKSAKIWLAIAGVLLIALGVMCIIKPAATLFATAWMIGIFTLAAGISKLIFTLQTESFLPNSATRALSAVLEILIGIIFLAYNLFLAASLPVIFAMWVIIEGVIITVDSFDFKRVGFRGWYVLLILGICGIVLGVLGLRNPALSATTLSTMIGLGVITMGLAYLLTVMGINRFDKKEKAVRREVGVDEQ